MIAKKDSNFSKIETTSEGTCLRFSCQDTVEEALADCKVWQVFPSLQYLKDHDYTILPLTFETLTIGDVVKIEAGKNIIGFAQGYGVRRVYGLIKGDGNALASFTAKELKDRDFTIIQPEGVEAKEEMIKVDGKDISLSTVKEALKAYLG